ncbi:MAG TPA: polysaccharide deacetylase family protein, partial [Fervidobacterium sp.]|nr:polysaccharide deacetylase family protein [Fervidobacterium sp.]
MKKAMLTVDIEEWYHLEYLDSVEEDRQRVKMVPAVLNLLDLLDEYSIKAVFFVLADIAEEYFDILCEIKDRGHEIGCHGYDHRLLHEMS